jgi:serine/threonine-protein kinase
MGSVWVGHHLQLDVPIAVKFMDAGVAASPDQRMRFEREAKAAAKLKSPHIIQVHDYGVEEGTPYIVMELLDGEDLDTRLRRAGRLSLPAASAITTQIAKALRSAHEAGIVHRDLKPANIFLCRHQDEEIVKVLDFGIAKATGEAGPGTATGIVMGSVHYMSPEQTRASKDLDGRSDLWSLGVVLYRCVTGCLPFIGDQVSQVLVAINVDPIALPSQIARNLGPDVDQFFARALARDPAHRFQSAREFADAFAALAGVAGTGPASFSQPALAPAPPSKPITSPVSAVSNSAMPSAGTFTSSERSLPALPPQRRGALLPVAVGALLLGAAGGAVFFLRAGTSPSSPAASAAPLVAASPPASPPPSTPPTITAATPTASATAPTPSASATPTATQHAPQGKAPAAPAGAPKQPIAKDPLFGF